MSIITPEATISYPNLFKPRLPPNSKPGQDPEYGATFLFTAEAAASKEFAAIKDSVLTAARDKWGTKADDMIRTGALRLPFRKDVEAKGYPAEFSLFINARSKQPPGVVSKYAGNDGKPMPITDEREIYAGAKVRASLVAFAYDQQGNKGVSLGLRNVQKLGNGPRLDGRRAAEDEFEATEKAPADMPTSDADTLANLLA